MAMGTARRGGMSAAINVTPMIDVLLVLLIIFMVVQQGLQKGVSVQIPPPKSDPGPPDPGAIVLEVRTGGGYAINQQPVDMANLQPTIARIFTGRPRKVLFVKADAGLRYGDVVAAVDAGRAAGVQVVGLVPRPES